MKVTDKREEMCTEFMREVPVLLTHEGRKREKGKRGEERVNRTVWEEVIHCV